MLGVADDSLPSSAPPPSPHSALHLKALDHIYRSRCPLSYSLRGAGVCV